MKQHTNCNICDNDNTSLITTCNNYTVVKCNYCGLVYLNPRISQERLLELYNDYHQRNGKDEQTWANLMSKNFKEVSLLLNRLFPNKGNILDIGCGYGHFIEEMKDYGWSVLGIEPSSKIYESSKIKDLNIIQTSIDEINFPKDTFDAVTAFYVLEHLFNPVSALRKIYSTLKRGGLLVLRVPNTTPIVKLLSCLNIGNNLYDLPYHLYDFSPKTIRLLLEKTGYSSIEVRPGSPTLPPQFIERLFSISSTSLSKLIFVITLKKFLLPGVSMTIIATKK